MGTISISDAARDLKQRIERPTDVWGWERLIAEKDAEIERLRAALTESYENELYSALHTGVTNGDDLWWPRRYERC